MLRLSCIRRDKNAYAVILDFMIIINMSLKVQTHDIGRIFPDEQENECII